MKILITMSGSYFIYFIYSLSPGPPPPKKKICLCMANLLQRWKSPSTPFMSLERKPVISNLPLQSRITKLTKCSPLHNLFCFVLFIISVNCFTFLLLWWIDLHCTYWLYGFLHVTYVVFIWSFTIAQVTQKSSAVYENFSSRKQKLYENEQRSKMNTKYNTTTVPNNYEVLYM